MRFENVYGQETHLAAVLFVEFVEGGNLPPIGRSGVAPEDQYHRSTGIQRRQRYVRSLVERLKTELGRYIAGM